MLRLPSGSDHRRSTVIAAALATAGLVLLAGCGGSTDRSQPVEAGGQPATTATTIPASVGAASVAEASVGTTPAPDGSWRAVGLVQNPGATAVGGVHVEATLLGADGATLSVVEGDSPVAPVRAHESVPFTLTAPDVVSSAVASVTWRAFATAGPTGDAGRDLAVSTYWTRPYGDGHRLDLPSYRDPAGATTPFALYASLTDGGAAPIGDPALVLAWTGRDGRVLAVASGRAVDSQGAPVASLAPGASDDVLVLVDDASAGPGLDQLTPQTWSTGR